MSRTDKDAPWSHGGKRRKYWTSEKWHARFTRDCRRRARRAAQRDLDRAGDPAPKYPIEHQYYD